MRLLLTVILFASNYAHADVCSEWFQKAKVSLSDSLCKSKCRVLQADMSTFVCNQQCDVFCKDPCPELLKKIEQNVSSKKPMSWPNKDNISVWRNSEKKQIVESLSRLPEAFQKLGAFEVIKFDKSKDFPNPASNVRDDKLYIAIYNSLFSNDYSIDRVLVHEFAHQYYRSMPLADVQSYQLSTNWFMDTKNLNKVIGQRSMGFVTEDSLSAPEEDFANNLEYYLILPEVLTSKYSPAYNWIRENIPNIKMQEGCKYEN